MIRVLILTIVLAVPGVSNASERVSFDRMDVFELEGVSNPQISPDGRRVVYNRNSMDVMKDRKTVHVSLLKVPPKMGPKFTFIGWRRVRPQD